MKIGIGVGVNGQTGAASPVGPVEVLVNGDLSDGLNGWTDTSLGSGSMTLSVNRLRLNSTSSTNRGRCQQILSTVPGTTYSYSLPMVFTGGTTSAIYFGTTENGFDLEQRLSLGTGATTTVYSGTFVAPTTTTFFTLWGPNTSTNSTWDNMSIVSVP